MVSNYFYAAVHPSAARVNADRYSHRRRAIRTGELPGTALSTGLYLGLDENVPKPETTWLVATKTPGGMNSAGGFG
jgi:hypothetical protein